MAGEDRYDSAVAAEFERLWQELVLERTSAGVKAAVEAALAQIVTEAKAAALTGQKTGEALEAKIAALSEIDKRVGNLLDQAHRQQERVAEAARQADALSTSLGEAEAAMQRLAGGGERVDGIAHRIASIEASLGRTGLSDEIGRIIDEGRAQQVDSAVTLDAIAATLVATQPPEQPKPGGVPASEEPAGRWSWKKVVDWWRQSWTHLLAVLVGAAIAAGTALGLDLVRPDIYAPPAPQHEVYDAAYGDAIESGWTKLHGRRPRDFASFCPEEGCGSFDKTWDDAGQREDGQGALFRAIFAGVGERFEAGEVDCPKIVEGLAANQDYAQLSRPEVERAGHCVISQNFKAGRSGIRAEVAKALTAGYLVKLNSEREGEVAEGEIASDEAPGDAAMASEARPKGSAKTTPTAKASTAAPKDTAAPESAATTPASAANPQ
ncbi:MULTISPECIES: hypothetical protein [unclassified Sphingopyxis]|uniref:hypothetical protein n=1 Tax=unclassified Sphingopyxis TaxID=2614943 RepID=UPI00073652AB|nr:MULTISPECIES: hypothetical protein [unclassified Sphingopyxis]KTE37423.1 hypothetical protein ATE62_13850 [Sphingopyxis sp. HIX]KTE85523.1 hypothetical protein ATE72_03485 [Sphingopyxis sp. HXXIV]